jgi:MFS family permease
VVTLFVLVSGFVCTRWFSVMITRPVDQLLNLTQLLAHGKLEEVLKEFDQFPAFREHKLDSFVSGVPTGNRNCPLFNGRSAEAESTEEFFPFLEFRTCDIRESAGKDELMRLLLAFRFIAVDIRRYRELFKYLIAFLIYNDAIGTIIGIAVIYGAELGFGDVELILALLLVQFVGIPFSLIFGRLPSQGENRRPLFLAFIVFNLVALPLAGIGGRLLLPGEISGGPLPPYESTTTAFGEGVYLADSAAITYSGDWETVTVPAAELRVGGLIGFLNGELTQDDSGVLYAISAEPGARYAFPFNGQEIDIIYSTGPDRGIWAVEIDGQPVIDEDTGQPLRLDAYNATIRYGERRTFAATTPGEHILSVISTGEKNPASAGTTLSLAQIDVRPPIRLSSLPLVIGLILAVEGIGVLFALALGRSLFSRLTDLLDTKRSIILALILYAVIAVWGYFIDSVVEFWFLAWMVAIVQGGSQALSRSLYATLSPAAKSGEFFGLFGVMEKFSSLIGPLLFALAGALFGSSRPAILSLIAFFIIGILLLTRVNVAEGRRVAQAEDAALLAAEI